MTGKPIVGQKVRLNDDGLMCIFGHVHHFEYLKSRELTIKRVGNEIPMVFDTAWDIELEEYPSLVLTNHDVDLV